MPQHTFVFPVGYHEFNKTQIINFQLNRWYSLGYTNFEETAAVGKRIRNFADWKKEMTALAKQAESEQQLINAAFYYRAAEFFVLPNDPDKEKLYDKFIELFYTAFQEESIEKVTIPYEGGFLSAMRVISNTPRKKGTILMHGGFDSFIEEFYSLATYFASQGYEVIAFEGPGQGATLKKHDLPLTHEWEKPTKAVLDYFNLNNVTLLGISMGGYLCLRAAAFEPRIKRVIALSVVFDYLQIPPLLVSMLARFLLRFRTLMNYLAYIKTKIRFQENWAVHNMMHITKTKKPIEAIDAVLQFNEANLHSARITQDVLLLSGAEDHFIPLKMHFKQKNALLNAHSVSDHIFTAQDHAQNHCQIGNIGLALEVMVQWIKSKS